MSSSLAKLVPEDKLEVKKKKHEVLSALGSFRDKFKMTIPTEGSLGWIEGRQYNYGKLLIITSRASNSEGCITAELSEHKPYTVTYEKVMYKKVACGKRTFDVVETSRTPYRITDIIEYQNSGALLQDPMDKAVRDTTNAERNLSILVQWFYMCCGVVNVTNDNCDAFARELKTTTKSINLHGTPNRMDRRSRVGGAPSARSLEAAGKHRDSNISQNTPHSSVPHNGLDTSSNHQQYRNTSDRSRLVQADQHRPSLHSDSFEDAVKDNPDTAVQDVCDMLRRKSSEVAETSADKISDYPADSIVAQTALTIPNVFLRGLWTRQEDVPSAENVVSAAPKPHTDATVVFYTGTENDTRSIQTKVEHSLKENGLLKYSKDITRNIEVVRYAQKGYIPWIIHMEDEGQQKCVFACLQANHRNPEVHIFVQEGEGSRKVGVSISRHVQRVLRRPFNQAISLDVPPGEKPDGGDRLHLFCKFVFIVKEKTPWSTFASSDVEKIIPMLAFMHGNEPELDAHASREPLRRTRPAGLPSNVGRLPNAANKDDDVVDLRSSAAPTRPGKRERERTHRSPPPYEPLNTPVMLPSNGSVLDSGFVSASPSGTFRHTNSPAVRAQECRTAHGVRLLDSNISQSPLNAPEFSGMGEVEAFDDATRAYDQRVVTYEGEAPTQNERNRIEDSICSGALRGQKRNAEDSELSDIHSQAEKLKKADIASLTEEWNEEKSRILAELAVKEQAWEEALMRIREMPDTERVRRHIAQAKEKQAALVEQGQRADEEERRRRCRLATVGDEIAAYGRLLGEHGQQ